MQFLRNLNILGAMRNTLVTTDAMVSLAQPGNTSVIPDQKSTARLTIIFSLTTLRHMALIHTFVIMQQYGRNIDTIRTRHAILTVIARNGRKLHHQISRIIQELHFLSS